MKARHFIALCVVAYPFLCFSQTNIALGKSATASSTESGLYSASAAVDGDATSSRWSSEFSDPQWITVDMGQIEYVDQVIIKWEAANAKDYTIQFSNDNINWINGGNYPNQVDLARTDTRTGFNTHARYVRIYCMQRNTSFGYSIYEIEIYGSIYYKVFTERVGLTGESFSFSWPNGQFNSSGSISGVESVTDTPTEGSHSIKITFNSTTGEGAGSVDYQPVGVGGPGPKNLSAFANGFFNFSIKIPPSNTNTFKVEVRTNISPYDVSYISFENGNDPYGVKRNDQWYRVSVPCQDLIAPTKDYMGKSASGLNINSVISPLCVNAIVTSDNVNDILYLDDIYYSSISSMFISGTQNWGTASSWTNNLLPSPANIVTLNSDATITIASGITAWAKDLILSPNSALVINSGGTLTVTGKMIVESNATATATFINNGTLTLSAGAEVIIQKYIENKSANPYGMTVASPISTAGVDVFSGSNGVYYYNAPAVAWYAFDSGYMANMVGYWTRFDGYKKLEFRTSNSLDINTGNKTYTNFYRTGFASGNSGWNLIGNPFAATISWDQVVLDNGGASFVTSTKLNQAVYVSNLRGGYHSCVAGVCTTPAKFNGYIPAATAFWVQINKDYINASGPVSGATLTLNSSALTIQGISDMSLKSASTENRNLIRLTIARQGDVEGDVAVVRFHPEATTDFDGSWDAIKRMSDNKGTPQIYTLSNNERYCINSLGVEPSLTTIPIGIYSNKGTTHTITLNSLELDEFSTVFLEDKLLGAFINFKAEPVYVFERNKNEDDDRFVLHVTLAANNVSTTNADDNDSKICKIVVYSEGKQLFVSGGEGQTTVEIWSLDVQLISSHTTLGDAIVINTPAVSGIYVVRVKCLGQEFFQLFEFN